MTINQFEINKHYKGKSKLSNAVSVQICKIHYVSSSESNEVDFFLTTSNGSKIYFKLQNGRYATDKLVKLKNFSYTQYYEYFPNGEWEIYSIIAPPLPKDITASSIWNCSRVDLSNPDTFVMKSKFYNGVTFFTGIDNTSEKEVLVYVDDTLCYKENTGSNSASKFWTIHVGSYKKILDIQRRITNENDSVSFYSSSDF